MNLDFYSRVAGFSRSPQLGVNVEHELLFHEWQKTVDRSRDNCICNVIIIGNLDLSASTTIETNLPPPQPQPSMWRTH